MGFRLMKERAHAGFSLIELSAALAITLVVALSVFQLFHQNERVFNDQLAVFEMQQNVRAVAFQIGQELARAGQGLPNYAFAFDSSPTEASAVILNGSDTTHLRWRAASTVETHVSQAGPVDFTAGMQRTIIVGDAAAFSSAVGGTSPFGRFVYISGSTNGVCWGWLRAELNFIDSTAGRLTVTPRELGDGCRFNDQNIQFLIRPTVVLEEALSVHIGGGSIWRAAATGMSFPVSPEWGPMSELGRHFATLAFDYYDREGNRVTPDTLEKRLRVTRVDVHAVAQTAVPLSNDSRPVFGIIVTPNLRNLGIRR